MKRILITGANSYIGTSFENYMKQWTNNYKVDTVDMIDGSWRDKSFSGYDSVFHVAGIAHQKETKKNKDLYYEVNRDLAIETSQKAKADGVKQFIFLSSMSVYGMDTGVITRDTIPNPKSNYGKSKLEAEYGIKQLPDDNFKVVILRPPMVYGKGCKGNFQTLIKIAKKSPVFPSIENKRSMIYIDNLSSFIKMVLDENLDGVMFPQNDKYACTEKIVLIIGEELGKKITPSKLMQPFVKAGILLIPKLRKAFGSLVYKDVTNFSYKYIVCDFDSSLKNSV